VVIEWIVSGFIAVGNALAGAMEAVFSSVGLAGSSAGDAIVDGGSAVAQAIFAAVFALNNAILDLASSSGPIAPLVVVGLFVGIALALLTLFVLLRKVILWVT
jgi:hypothetical protein